VGALFRRGGQVVDADVFLAVREIDLQDLVCEVVHLFEADQGFAKQLRLGPPIDAGYNDNKPGMHLSPSVERSEIGRIVGDDD
jgi:hypothetical protein